MKKVLVTGASGFIGANLVHRLLHDGHQAHACVRTQSDLWRLKDVQDHMQIHRIDIADRTHVSELVSNIRPDWIFHLAVNGAYSWQTNVHEMINSNIIGTCNLVEACLENGFEAFINTGSSSEYGFKDHAPSEEEVLHPNSCYAVTKASQTMYCQYLAQSRNANISTLRLYSVYGPWEDPNRLIPVLITKGLKGRLPKLGAPSVARDFIYIDDVVDAYLLLAETQINEPGAVYNLGAGIQTSMREVIDLARTIFSIKEEPQWGSAEKRVWDTDVWVSNPEKFYVKLGFRPKFSLYDGLKSSIDWLINTPGMLPFYEQAIMPAATTGQKPGLLSLPLAESPYDRPGYSGCRAAYNGRLHL